MLRSIVDFSVRNKSIVFFGVILLVLAGSIATSLLPIDAVPDITTNQVQVITVSTGLPAEDVERFVTFPVEQRLANLPGIVDLRSISRFGLSLVTVVFDEKVPTLQARQLIAEQLRQASNDIPPVFGIPEMMPITTGLGEIYQYALDVDPQYADRYDAMELRTIQDWLVKRQLSGIEGIIDVSSFGGLVKQYEVAYQPQRMAALGITPDMLLGALENNNTNTGAGYINEGKKAVYIRTEGLITGLDELGKILVSARDGHPVLVKDIAEVRYGAALRYGALTKDGKGETVGGITLLLKDANAKATVERVKLRIDEIQKSLPKGVRIVPYLERSELVSRTIGTAVENLAVGGLVVALVLIFFLGDFRSGLLVASIIPLSMLFALLMMWLFGVSANLMSLGAVDLGIVVDGAVIIVEGILHAFAIGYVGHKLSKAESDQIAIDATVQVYKSAAFGVLIILVVFFPVLYLGGIEGKMFQPMALTLIFALTGALILSVTFIPAAGALLLRKINLQKSTLGERWMKRMAGAYKAWLERILPARALTMTGLVVAMGLTIWRIGDMGAVFVPDLEEGDLAMQMAVRSGSNVEEVVAIATAVEQRLLRAFPDELRSVVSKIGTAEIPTDPMAIEDADIMLLLHPKDQWQRASDRYALVSLMKEELEAFPDVEFEFSQPIQLRFNELISGSKADIAVKVFGPHTEELRKVGERAEALIAQIDGADDVKLERTEGLMQLIIEPNRDKLVWYGLDVADVNLAIQSAYSGAQAGVIYEDERRFNLVMRMDKIAEAAPDLSSIMLRAKNGNMVSLDQVIDKKRDEGIAMVTREKAQRRISIGVNVRNRSLTKVVDDIKKELEANLNMPPGYSIRYEGEFRNYEEARSRLLVAVPISLLIILGLLYFTFARWRHAVLVFSAVPFTTIGGIWALSIRGLPFSISAGIGFIALFGVGVLNSIVLISHINHMRETHPEMDLRKLVALAASDRYRPVILTALTAVLGFLPMALSTNAGAEVQRPLATVVIGGLFVDTFLTLVYLPKLYFWLETRLHGKKALSSAALIAALTILGASTEGFAQNRQAVTWDDFKTAAFAYNPNLELRESMLDFERERSGENWQIQPTQMQYGYGQLNKVPFAQDYQWLFTQDFGSIPEHIYRGKRQEARIAATDAEIQAFKKNFEADLKIAYLQWIAAHERLEITRSYSSRLDSLEQRVKSQARVGDIPATQQYIFEAELLRLRREKAQNEIILGQKALVLERLCQFDVSGLQPSEDNGFGVLHPIPDTLFTRRYSRAQEVRIEEGEFGLKMQRSAFFPALSAGYQRARLEGESGGDAYFLGVSLPLWYGPDKSRSRQAGIILDQEQMKLEAIKFSLAAEARQQYQAYLSLRSLYESDGIEFYHKSLQLSSKAESVFRTGETDAYQLLQALSAAYQLHLQYLDLSEDYGSARINLTRYDSE